MSGGLTGIFGEQGQIVIWLHLAECYLQLEKQLTAEKCTKQVLKLLQEYLPEAEDGLIFKINRGKEDGSLLSDI
jgi:glutathione synthase/RimK-type ligase-like ATP-grasp enzyme